MNNQLIDWDKITLSEAQEIADQLCSAFSVTSKCWCALEEMDVSYLNVVCPYDDELQTEASKRLSY